MSDITRLIDRKMDEAYRTAEVGICRPLFRGVLTMHGKPLGRGRILPRWLRWIPFRRRVL